MSIIIKGMEMPRGCNDCHRCYWSNLDQSYKCDLTKSELQVKDAMIERNADCPLVEIPKGARLIDANSFDDFLGVEDRDIYCRNVVDNEVPIFFEEELE